MSNNSQFSSHKRGSSYTIKINSTLYNLSMKPSTLGPNFFISREIYGNFQNWNFPSAQVNESTQNMLSGASQSETAITSRLRRKPWPSSVRCEAACKWRRAAVCWWSACWSGPHLRPLLGSATLRGLSISSGSESALLSVHKNAPVKCHISHLSGPKMCNLHRTTYNDVLCVGGASEACDMAVVKKWQKKKLFTSQTCYLPRLPTLTYLLKFCTGFEIKGGVSPLPLSRLFTYITYTYVIPFFYIVMAIMILHCCICKSPVVFQLSCMPFLPCRLLTGMYAFLPCRLLTGNGRN